MSERPASKLFGGLLIAVGFLFAVTSGGCSLMLVVSMRGSLFHGPAVLANLIGGVMMLSIFGGVPFLFGVAMIVGGRALMKPSRPARQPPPVGQDGPGAPPRADL